MASNAIKQVLFRFYYRPYCLRLCGLHLHHIVLMIICSINVSMVQRILSSCQSFVFKLLMLYASLSWETFKQRFPNYKNWSYKNNRINVVPFVVSHSHLLYQNLLKLNLCSGTSGLQLGNRVFFSNKKDASYSTIYLKAEYLM